jgi:hypothetical protein
VPACNETAARPRPDRPTPRRHSDLFRLGYRKVEIKPLH